MKRKLFFTVVLLLCCVAFSDVTPGQTNDATCADKKVFSTWLNCQVDNAVRARINQRNPTKQSETPSISTGSTSLVDQSSASDLLNGALNFAGIDNKSSDADKSSFSVTTSAYALFAASRAHDPLDPAFYLKNRNWRRVWFTLGQELPESDDQANGQKANIYGIKILLWDRRDISSTANRKKIQDLVQAMGPAAVNFANIREEVFNYLFNTFGAVSGFPGTGAVADVRRNKINFENRLEDEQGFASVLSIMRDNDMKEIDEIIMERIDLEVQLADKLRKTIEEVRRAPQFSLAFQSKARADNGVDEYRGEAIFDYGVANRVNLSLNASFDYKDSKIIGGDMRGGRFALESQFQMTPETKLTGREPWVFSLGAEGEWLTQMAAKFQAQAKLKVPLMNGLNLPISVSWSNRTELIKESEVRGRFGFTFDIAKLANAFR